VTQPPPAPGYGPPPGYGPLPGYGPPPGYGPGYGPPPGYGPGYGPPPGYGPGYGPTAYGYGPASWPLPPVQRPWPYGDGRPTVATAAGVLGIVTGGLTAMACLLLLIVALTGVGDPVSLLVLVLGVPCAAGTITGGIRLLQGHRRGLLLGSALASVAVLVLGFLVATAIYDGEEVLSVFVVLAPAVPLPVVTAVTAALGPVKGWTEAALPR
jgi:hypothetical protein